MAASYTASGATISSIRPRASASLASTNRPENTRSLALLSPIVRASRVVSPGAKPERISVAPTLMLSPATRQSAPSASVSRGHGRLGNRGERVDGLPTDLGGHLRFFRVHRLTHRHVVARREDLMAAEQDHRSDVVPRAEFGCSGNDFAVHLTGQRIGRRPGQQQGGDARVLVEGVNADELPHGVRPPSAWL